MPVRSVTLRILGDDRDALAALARVDAAAHKLTDRPWTVKIATDGDAALLTKLAALQARLDTLTGRIWGVKITCDGGECATQVADLASAEKDAASAAKDFTTAESAASKAASSAADNAAKAARAFLALAAAQRLAALAALGTGAADRGLLASLGALRRVPPSPEGRLAESAGAAYGLPPLTQTLTEVVRIQAAAGGDQGGGGGFLGGLLGGLFGGGGRGGGGMMGRFARGGFWAGLFGGGTIAGIGLFHVALEGLVEALISVGSAAMAATVGLAAMYPTMQDLYTQFKSVSIVNSALGDQIPTLSTKFSQLQNAMAPRVIEAYGGALSMLSHNTGVLNQTGSQVTTMFDNAVIKIQAWAHNTGILGLALHAGTGFLHQFGQAAGYVGLALTNLLKADPGIAHFLLDILVGAARLLNVITSLPRPLLETALALHGVYFWGRILGAVLLSAARGAATLAVRLALLAANPLTWVAAAAVALGYMALQASKAQKPIVALEAAMENKLGTENASQAMITLGTDIGILQAKINSLNTTKIEQMFGPHNFSVASFQGGFQKLGDAVASFWGHIANAFSGPAHGKLGVSGITGFFHDIGSAFSSLVSSSGADSVAFSRDLNSMNAEINKFLGSSRNFAHEIGTLMKSGHSYADALALMDLAGVKWNDTASTMFWKVVNLQRGYAQMSIRGGILANSVQALNFATLQQQSQVGQLTAAWSAFFNTLVSGESGFVGFAQQLSAMRQAASGAASGLSTVNGAVRVSTPATAAAGAAAAKTAVNINGLGQNALQLRSAWLQSAQAAQQELNNLTMMASAAGLGARGTAMLAQATKDMISQLLPAAKGSQALTTILYGLAQQGGYRGADSFKALADWIGKVHDPMKNLDKITTTFTVHMGNLTTDVKNLSTALGTTLTQAMSQAIFLAGGGQQALNNVATALYKSGVNSDAFRDTLGPLSGQMQILTGNTNRAHQMFDTFMIGLGLTKREADKLWQSVKNVGAAIAALHDKKIDLTETGVGQFSIRGTGPTKQAGTTGQGRFPAAQGMFVHQGTGPTADDVLARVSRGELIVPHRLVAAGLVDHLRGMIPGFATGGYLGPIAGLAPRTTAWDQQFTAAMTSAMEAAMTAAMRTAIASAMAAARSFGPGAGGATGNAQQMAMAMLGRYGWGGQWAALNYVAMRESGWSMTARNPTSGAYGIAQFINGPSEYYQYGGNPNTLAGQLTGFFNYIRSRYGNPANAAAHEARFGWYDGGGVLPPGLTMALNTTGASEMVVPRARPGHDGAGGGVHFHINVSGDFANPDATALRIIQAIKKYKLHHGQQPTGIG